MQETYKLNEKVFAEDAWWLVLIDNLFDLRMAFDTAFKQVQWRIIPVVDSILNVFLETQFQLMTRLALTHLEPSVSEPFNKSLFTR